MSKLTKLVVDLSLPEGHPEREKSIPLTPEELAEREALAAQAELDRLEREAAEQARLEAEASAKAKLEALGLTPEEIAALKA